MSFRFGHSARAHRARGPWAALSRPQYYSQQSNCNSTNSWIYRRCASDSVWQLLGREQSLWLPRYLYDTKLARELSAKDNENWVEKEVYVYFYDTATHPVVYAFDNKRITGNIIEVFYIKR